MTLSFRARLGLAMSAGLMLVGVGALGMVTRRRARTARVNFG